MTTEEEAEWQQRLQAAVAETIRRRQARRDLRAQLDKARAHGLQQRHHAKLNHGHRTHT